MLKGVYRLIEHRECVCVDVMRDLSLTVVPPRLIGRESGPPGVCVRSRPCTPCKLSLWL